jgi:hypothetical protein
MPLVNFSNLDFDQIKTTLRDYLKANSNFTDYDFEGSNSQQFLMFWHIILTLLHIMQTWLQMKFLLIVQL